MPYSLKYPTTKTTESVLPEDDNDWVTIENIGADDGVYTSITATTYDANDISYRAKAQGFGFTIPSGAVIDGIVVQIERRCAAGSAVDYRVQLLDETGALVGDNKADTVNAWPAADTVKTYGGAADKWGWAAPTADKINNANFGVVLSAKATGANTDIYVDYIRITVYYGTIEDFTTYTEVDPNGRITVTSPKVAWADLSCNEDAHVYKDKGVNHFAGDFEHLVENQLTSAAANAWVVTWMVANDIDDWNGLRGASLSHLAVYDFRGTSPAVEPIWGIFEQDGASAYNDETPTGLFSFGTTYYLKIKRDESVGTYGTIYGYIYSDVARTTLLDTLTVALHTSKKDYRYIYGADTHNIALSTHYQTGFTENLDLQEAGVIQKILSEVFASTDILIKGSRRTLSEIYNLTDSIVKGSRKTLNEILNITDTVVKGIQRALAEAFNLTDAITKVKGALKILTEAFANSDSIQKISNLVRTLTETFNNADSIVKSIRRTLTETFNFTDSIQKIQGIIRTFDETFNITDTITTIKSVIRTLTETFQIEDAITKIKGLHQTLTETFASADSIIRGIGRTLAEEISIKEIFKRYLNGILVIWTKVAKLATDWTKKSKPTTTYTKLDKPSTIWTKLEKPDV